eukprot:tig00021072_g17963.t1
MQAKTCPHPFVASTPEGPVCTVCGACVGVAFEFEFEGRGYAGSRVVDSFNERDAHGPGTDGRGGGSTTSPNCKAHRDGRDLELLTALRETAERMSLPRPRSAARRALGILNESGSHVNSDAEPDGHGNGRTAGRAYGGLALRAALYEAARLRAVSRADRTPRCSHMHA